MVTCCGALGRDLNGLLEGDWGGDLRGLLERDFDGNLLGLLERDFDGLLEGDCDGVLRLFDGDFDVLQEDHLFYILYKNVISSSVKVTD
jgi:hypothetical protein